MKIVFVFLIAIQFCATSCHKRNMYRYFYDSTINYSTLLKDFNIQSNGIYKCQECSMDLLNNNFGGVKMEMCRFLRFQENGKVFFGNMSCKMSTEDAFQTIVEFNDRGYLDNSESFQFSTYFNYSEQPTIWQGIVSDSGLIVSCNEPYNFDSVYFKFQPVE